MGTTSVNTVVISSESWQDKKVQVKHIARYDPETKQKQTPLFHWCNFHILYEVELIKIRLLINILRTFFESALKSA